MEHGARLSSSGCWDGPKLSSAETAPTLVSHHIPFLLTENSCQCLFSSNDQWDTPVFIVYSPFFLLVLHNQIMQLILAK